MFHISLGYFRWLYYLMLFPTDLGCTRVGILGSKDPMDFFWSPGRSVAEEKPIVFSAFDRGDRLCQTWQAGKSTKQHELNGHSNGEIIYQWGIVDICLITRGILWDWCSPSNPIRQLSISWNSPCGSCEFQARIEVRNHQPFRTCPLYAIWSQRASGTAETPVSLLGIVRSAMVLVDWNPFRIVFVQWIWVKLIGP